MQAISKFSKASFILVMCLGFGQSFAQPPSNTGGHPPRGGPPQEAISACADKTQGDACDFEAPHGTISGTCRARNNQQFCVPANHRPGKAMGKPG